MCIHYLATPVCIYIYIFFSTAYLYKVLLKSNETGTIIFFIKNWTMNQHYPLQSNSLGKPHTGNRVASIAIPYRLDSLGIESRWWRNVPHSSRLALGHTQPPVHWVACLSPRGVKRPGRGLFHSFPSRLNKEYSSTSTPPLGLYGLFLGERSLYGI